MKLIHKFSQFSRYISSITGQPRTFACSCALVIVWLLLGPLFNFSDTWQLIINSLSSVVTFLMVFLIQNTQNRDTMALQIKLDELIRVQEGTHNALLDLEELTEEQLIEVSKKYRHIAQLARKNLESGKNDTHSEEI